MHASAADELARLLHVPLPSPTARATPPRPKTAMELQAEWIAAGNKGLYPLPPLRTTEQILKDLGYEPPETGQAPPPPPPPRSESKAAKLAKLLALISHPNTGESERVAAMHAYQRIMGEVG